MIGADLISAQGQDQHHAKQRDAAAQILDEVERRVVGPMDVLEHQDGGAVGVKQDVQKGGKELRGSRRLLEYGRKMRIERLGHVLQRTQWTRREKCLAAPPKYAAIGAYALRKFAKQGGLSDPCLAAENHRAAVSGADALHKAQQKLKLCVTLYEHGSNLAKSTPIRLPQLPYTLAASLSPARCRKLGSRSLKNGCVHRRGDAAPRLR